MSNFTFFLCSYALGTLISAISGNLDGLTALIGIAIGAAIGTIFRNMFFKDED